MHPRISEISIQIREKRLFLRRAPGSLLPLSKRTLLKISFILSGSEAEVPSIIASVFPDQWQLIGEENQCDTVGVRRVLTIGSVSLIGRFPRI
jgi:hypothetical protein